MRLRWNGRARNGRTGVLRMTAVAAVALIGASLAAPGPAAAVGKPSGSAATDVLGLQNFDARSGSSYHAAAPASVVAARDSLAASLGAQGVLQIDELTGTPRVVARLDGFLTGPEHGAGRADRARLRPGAPGRLRARRRRTSRRCTRAATTSTSWGRTT